MATICPTCGHDIPPEDVNVATDVAYCRGCDAPHRLSAMVEGGTSAGAALAERLMTTGSIPDGALAREATGEASGSGGVAPPPANLASPPIGCWYTDDGRQAEAGAKIRSGGSGAMVFAACFWNGITWLFVTLVISGAMGGDDVWIVGLFLLPFVAIGLLLAWLALLAMVGTVRVRVSAEAGEVFVGVGGRGWRKPFRPADVKDLRVGDSGTRVNGRVKQQAVLKLGGEDITFGTMLHQDRLEFVAGAAAQMLGLDGRR